MTRSDDRNDPENTHDDVSHVHSDLPPYSPTTPPTRLPKLQISILLLLKLCEPVTATVIYPFIAQLVNELGATHGDRRKTGYYVGMIESLFFLAQAVFVFQWSRLSDRIGRRPVLLIGLVGLSASMISFGLSKSFLGLVASRVIAGVLNGNVGIMKTMLAELTDDSNQAFAVSCLPITWVTGATIGPLIGGGLQHPAERFPVIFEGNMFFKTHPYALPCFSAAFFSLVALGLGAAFLKETLPPKAHNSWMKPSETTRLLDDGDDIPQGLDILSERQVEQPSMRDVLTRPFLITMLNYACLSLLDISHSALLTLFLAVPIDSGGLGLSPQTIGLVLGGFGLVSGVIQILLFSTIHARFGAKNLFMVGPCSFALVILPAYVVMHKLAVASGEVTPAIWAVLVIQLAFMCTTISC